MSDTISLNGKEYISSKRASELSGYAQDYIGQLSRSGQIDAQRVGGLWYVSMESLNLYKEKAEGYKPQPPINERSENPDSLISFDGKDYVSASMASKITGYHQDYVGQLARSGTVHSRQVGNRWYVEREGIIAHKRSKDALLAAVQADSVGLGYRPDDEILDQSSRENSVPEESKGLEMIYTPDDGDLIALEKAESGLNSELVKPQEEEYKIPIRIVEEKSAPVASYAPLGAGNGGVHERGLALRKSTLPMVLTGVTATIVIVLSLGYISFKSSSKYAENTVQQGFTAGVAGFVDGIGNILENLLSPGMVYKRVE